MKPPSAEQCAACLLGGAVGDALGWPVEFLSTGEIRQRFGPAGIRAFADAPGGIGAITDDTQMTLFTSEGLLHARYAKQGDDWDSCTSHVYQAYLRWLATQGEASPEEAARARTFGGLASIDRLHARRAPGNSCLTALASGRMGDVSNPVNDYKGCGGVMRVAPAALHCTTLIVGRETPADMHGAFDLGCRLAATTHGHPSGYLPAGTLAALLFGIAVGQPLTRALQGARTALLDWPGHKDCLERIDLAVLLWHNNEPPSSHTIERIGHGWTGVEALAIAIYCALAARDDFERGVLLAVNHGGDSDSTGSIAGTILGLLLGLEAIPSRFLAQLELCEVIKRTGMLLASSAGREN